ncbi:MAG: MMPL family transporter [Nitrospina sp.]|nr:MMPL family transporter [Nitrospina sp.]MBT5633941.1 MMPL family transporter [Nitrospina sp.]
MSSPPDPGVLNRFFFVIERFAYRHSVLVILVSLVLAFLSVWVTAQKLTFKTGRGDLVAKGLPYVKQYENYRQQFEDLEGMVVAVEGEKPTEMSGFAEALATKLKAQSHLFSQVVYKIDIGYFRSRFLLYLKQDELKTLSRKLEDHQGFLESVNDTPGLHPLLSSINAEISSGMVDSLLTDFLGEEDENGSEDAEDLSLLIRLLEEMTRSLMGETGYRSPWQSLFTGSSDSLREKGYMVSENEDLLFILLVPNNDKSSFTGYKDAVNLARQFIAEAKKEFPGIRVGLTGEDVISSDEMLTTQADVETASKIALIGVALLFIIAYRGVVKPLLAIFCLLLALCWTMGFTTLTIGHLNILSVVFTTILIGLGIDFGIHILERYKEERQEGNEILTALQNTLQGTGKGNFSGAITTAMAFGAMVLTDFIGIVELGWIAGWGILFCMIAMLLVLPALVTLEEKWRKPNYVKSVTAQQKGWIDKLFDHYYLIIGLCTVLVLVASLSLKGLRFDYNLLNLQAKGTEAVQYEMKILESAGRSAWSAAMLVDSLEEVRKKELQLKALPTVAKVESLSMVMPEHQEENLRTIRKNLAPLINEMEVEPEDVDFSWKALNNTLKHIQFKLQGREEDGKTLDPVQVAGNRLRNFLEQSKNVESGLAEKRLSKFSEVLFTDYRNLIEELKANAKTQSVRLEEIPSDLRKRYISSKGKYVIHIFPSVDIWDQDERKKYLNDLRSVDPNVTGTAVNMFESTRLMTEGYVKGGLYAMTAIVIYLFFMFRNVRTVFFVLLPVLAGSVWTVGIMDVIGLKLNMANLVILPLILGIGVVNGIHITHRYREEEDKNASVLGKSTGQAVLLSSLTTMMGFGSMMVADHYGVFSLGLVLTLGVLNCLIASVTFLPALLKLSTAKGWKV